MPIRCTQDGDEKETADSNRTEIFNQPKFHFAPVTRFPAPNGKVPASIVPWKHPFALRGELVSLAANRLNAPWALRMVLLLAQLRDVHIHGP